MRVVRHNAAFAAHHREQNTLGGATLISPQLIDSSTRG